MRHSLERVCVTLYPDAGAVQVGAYESKGKMFWYKPAEGADVTFKTSDAGELINHGGFLALADLSERLVGGDVYIKRALAARPRGYKFGGADAEAA